MNYNKGASSRSQAGRPTVPGIRDMFPEMDFETSSTSSSAASSPALSTMATRAAPAIAGPSSRPDGVANPSPPDTDSEEPRSAKAIKERDSRRKQALALQDAQDLLQFYAGITDGPQQSPGNSIKSGLTWTKDFISESANALLAHFLQEGYREATTLGPEALDQWKDNLQQILHQAHIAKNSMYGAWIVDQDPGGRVTTPGCAKDKGRGCRVHGHQDWRTCRSLRRSLALQRNRHQYLQSLRSQRASGH
ncbi:hypothetical protein KC340_g5076 [Hortaea werneckii]|nr:hypothetical protein KC342_g5365 [Hortaea werneckii]KAI7100813.1 hypothetical protein KC339_g7201 [Hortaea werneckii]KAI7228205.1 hypothetical protein KC365_g8586 [Hortaea werneckii]KAI7328499.1 hypothetical protein KC340_g5076 [Hortaea werneckii]KAI7402561.1 hypothetical protein KC328_g2725 [Hortaea werneckii]